MNIPSTPLPEDNPPYDVENFLSALKDDPGFAARMEGHYRAALALPKTPGAAGMQAAAGRALRTLLHHQGAWKALQALNKATGLIEAAIAQRDPAALREIQALTDEASDHLLDTLEPERTKVMAGITAIRERLRAVAQ